jgi:pectate lyase
MRFFEIATAAMTAASTAYGAPMEKRAAAVDELVGFAAGTTGGGSGAGTTVTSCAELTAAAKAGGVIKVKGMLTGCGVIRVGTAGTSILGVGKDAGLTDSGLQVFKTSNIIIRNLKLYRAPKGKDLIDIEGSTNVWVDHNDFSSIGITGDKDTYDGLLDAKSGADMLTFSWNKFHDHVSLHHAISS